MRYQEAYELIDTGVIAGGVEIPVSHNLMGIYFDQAVNDIAMRSVQKRDILLLKAIILDKYTKLSSTRQMFHLLMSHQLYPT